MKHFSRLYKNSISEDLSNKYLADLLKENPRLRQILLLAAQPADCLEGIREWIENELRDSDHGFRFYRHETFDRKAFEDLAWKDMAAIRILEYIDNDGRAFEDLNLHGQVAVTQPFTQLWKEVHQEGTHCSADYYEDMLQLFRQFRGELQLIKPDRATLNQWMSRWPDGRDLKIQTIRKANKLRIIKVFIEKMDQGKLQDPKFFFTPGLSYREKIALVEKWWQTSLFHLKFAVVDPDDLNDYLGNSLDAESLRDLHKATEKGIPFFVNLYYLSLLNVNPTAYALGRDQAIRDYVFYSKSLIEEYGNIVAWEREDEVKPDQPNAAGWMLPGSSNVHRRYPEVAILIPDTIGRACGGLCVSCQRMYDFQRGNLNFNLEKLRPKESWDQKLEKLLRYWEEDSQLRDLLITGGDALMSSNKSLEKILQAVLVMAKRKKDANMGRSPREKHAEMLRIRLGTRLPVYLPQRITPELVRILKEFRNQATKLGFKQFFIQTHFISPMEVTPDSVKAIEKLISAGWTITNQMVFTAAASRRGHSARLRQVLNDLGVVNYYTFSVKGYLENSFNFATNERAMQEQLEEKPFGKIPSEYKGEIANYSLHPEEIASRMSLLRKKIGSPFLGTDRNVLNLPGIGKSLTFRTIGITRYGRRILEFDHDHSRKHSPAARDQGKVIIIESKSIRQYLNQIESYGENPDEYESIWGYSIGVTEPKNPMYDYPEYPFEVSPEFSHLG